MGGWVCSLLRFQPPLHFWGSFALAALALESTFQRHGDPLGSFLRDVGLGALPTQRALRAARNDLHPKARKVLPPFDGLVSTPVRMLDVIEIGKQTHKALDGKW